MFQMLFLLCGTRLVRRCWAALFFLGFFWAFLGTYIHIDAVFSSHRHPPWIFAIPLAADGLWGLATSLATSGTTQKLRLARGVTFVLISLLVFIIPRQSSVFIGILAGLFVMADACWRGASAYVVRFTRWHNSFLYACFELLCGLWLLVPWPTYWAGAIGADVGMLLALSGLSFCGHALRIRRMPSSMSIAALLNRDWPAKNESYTLSPKRFDSKEDLIVHIWTPSVDGLAPIHQGIRRYVAALDKDGVVSTGHAALELPPDVYISLYPLEEIDRSGADFMRILNASTANNVPGIFQPSYLQESKDWCPSTIQVRLKGLNTEAVRLFWEEYRQDATYNLTSRSCASSVAKALDAGLEGIFEKQIRHSRLFLVRLIFTPEVAVAGFMRLRAEAMAWTPGLLLDYARALSYIISLPQREPSKNNNAGHAT